MRESPYKIFNASAGSGKTFTLVKEYLKIILSSGSQRAYQQILAVTFTNKAVNEMKQRILSSLAEMSTTAEGDEVSDMAKILMKELQTDMETLQKRSLSILQKILHNYAYFDVSTIDKFTHRLIRSFARDLKISQNFEVVLDTDLLLQEAIHNLLSQAGENEELSKALIDFALEKTDEEKHWDLNLDLFKVGQLLFRENELPHIEKLADKTIKDFRMLQKQLAEKIKRIEIKVNNTAQSVLDLLQKEGLEDSYFPKQTLPNHFKKICSGEFDPDRLYSNTLENQLKEGKYVIAKVDAPSDSTTEMILSNFLEIKTKLYERAFLRNAYKNLVPLTIMGAVYKAVKEIENERDLLPISSFNTIISSAIVNQPTPFIYERLGEKYRHYFIDEFQDTSQMQWNNLVPLVGNALEGLDEDGKQGSLLIVGDVKQAIYRWRGGEPEQFLNLISLQNNPFVINPSLYTLDTNFRSSEQIIRFNNSFFKQTSSLVGNSSYQRLFYEETQQKFNAKKGGLVQLEFIDGSSDEAYLNRTIKVLQTVLAKGYRYEDICILTRKRKHGVLISEGLIASGYPVASAETLLLKSNPKVRFLTDLLYAAHEPENLEVRFSILTYLIPAGPGRHSLILNGLNDLDSWLHDHWKFNMNRIRFQSVYDALEEAISVFGLAEESDAFITYLLDEVVFLEQKTDFGIANFLEYWEKNKDKLSITAPDHLNAIKIMTIHKAKGLEFPIVILPYANSDIYEEIEPKIWMPVPESDFEGFSEMLLNKKKQMTAYNELALQLYNEDHHKLELDAFNILYVALTRAIDGLFVITEKDLSSKGLHKLRRYSGLFIEYLKQSGSWEDQKDIYCFGFLNPKSVQSVMETVQEIIPFTPSSKRETRPKMVAKSPSLWEDQRAEAIAKGTRIHYIMSLIKDETDIEPVISLLTESGIISADEQEEVREQLLKIVSLPELIPYFKGDLLVKNEQEIISENGIILRPDRLVFQEDRVTIIDYKTGARRVEHKDQLLSYGTALKDMGFTLAHSIVVYLNDTITTEFIE